MKTPNSRLLMDYINFYNSYGIKSIIPLKRLTKEPLVVWKEFQERTPTSEELKKWFNYKTSLDLNLAIITGAINENLIVIDADSVEAMNQLKQILAKNSQNLFEKVIVNNDWIIRTGRGYHVYIRVEEEKDTFKQLFRTKTNWIDGIDVKGEGGYVVAPPSIHPDKKMPYMFQSNFFSKEKEINPIPILTKEEIEVLLNILKTTEETKKEEIEEKRKLNENELLEFAGLLKPFYKPGNREVLVGLNLSGWFLKAGIEKESLIELAKRFAVYDKEVNKSKDWEEKLNRIIKLIDYHYSRRWKEYALSVIESAKKGNTKLQEILKNAKVDLTKDQYTDKELEEIAKHVLKGQSGVQEILENAVGEAKALEIMRKLESILRVSSPFLQDAVFQLLSQKRQIYAVAKPKEKIIEIAKRTEDGFEDLEIVVAGVFTKVVKYVNPLGARPKFEVRVESITMDRPLELIGDIDYIIERLKAEGLVFNSRLVKDVISAIINGYIGKKKAEIKTEIESPGFYNIEGKIIPLKWNIEEMTEEELKKALITLTKLGNDWFTSKEKFATAIKWGVVAPFIYIRKQFGRQFQTPFLVLYGERDSGKTTLAEIISYYLWNNEKRSIGGAEANTEAKLGKVLAETTFPTVINECNSMFYKAEIINMLKNSVESTIARGKYIGGGSAYIEYPALSPLILTLNPSPPIDFEALELMPKTLYVIYFTVNDVIKNERKQAFEKAILEGELKLSNLKYLGFWIAKYVINNPDILKKNWLELGEELLLTAYKKAGLQAPDWIKTNYELPSMEDIIKNKVEEIRAKFIKYINEQYARNISRMVVSYENEKTLNNEDITLTQKLYALVKNNLLPFTIVKNESIFMTGNVLKELQLEIESLKSLAELLGWSYYPKKSIRVGDRVINISAIEIKIEDLLAFLNPQIE